MSSAARKLSLAVPGFPMGLAAETTGAQMEAGAEEGPRWSDALGAWVFLSHADVRDALRDERLGASRVDFHEAPLQGPGEELLQAFRKSASGRAEGSRELMAPAAELAEQLVAPVVDDLELRRGESVLAFVNGLGGTPQLELYLMFAEVSRALAARGVSVARSLVGNYATSLDMAGCSLTLLRVDEPLVGLWDAPVTTPSLRWGH